MIQKRLLRLIALTQGAALVGMGAAGASTIGCSKESGADPTLHINAPYVPQEAGASTPTDTTGQPVQIDAPDGGRRWTHTVNAPPRRWRADGGMMPPDDSP